jgi:hypothetical protein
LGYRDPFIFTELKGSEVTMTPNEIIYIFSELQSAAYIVNKQ